MEAQFVGNVRIELNILHLKNNLLVLFVLFIYFFHQWIHVLPVIKAAHNGSEHPRAGGNGGLLPDGAGHWSVGLDEVQTGAEKQPSSPDRGHFAGKQRDQYGSRSLHNDR